mgnify:CR=1 FL=1
MFDIAAAAQVPGGVPVAAPSLQQFAGTLMAGGDASVQVLVVDDLLATGGTAAAAGELVHRQGAEVHAYAFVVELESLGGFVADSDHLEGDHIHLARLHWSIIIRQAEMLIIRLTREREAGQHFIQVHELIGQHRPGGKRGGVQ